MNKYSSFKTQSEVDAWYEEAVTGIGRALALEVKSSKGNIESTHYKIALLALGKLRNQAYQSLRLTCDAPTVDVRELAGRLEVGLE